MSTRYDKIFVKELVRIIIFFYFQVVCFRFVSFARFKTSRKLRKNKVPFTTDEYKAFYCLQT